MNKIENAFKRLVIVAYRLPFKFTKVKDGYKAVQNSGGLVSAILSLSQKMPIASTDVEKNCMGRNV